MIDKKEVIMLQECNLNVHETYQIFVHGWFFNTV